MGTEHRLILAVVCPDTNLELLLAELLDQSHLFSCARLSEMEEAHRSRSDIVASIFVGDWKSSRRHHCLSAEASSARELPWLHVTCGEDGRLILGPLFSHDDVPCYECFLTTLEADTIAADNYVLNARDIAILAALISLELAKLVKSPGRSSGARSVLVYDFARHTTGELMVPRQPGCNHCWPRLTGQRHPDVTRSLPAFYDECARLRPTTNLVAAEWDYLTRADGVVPKYFQDCDKFALEPWCNLYEGALACSELREEGAFLSQIDIAQLAFLSFGRLESPLSTRVDRTLPSAGNLGSTEAFLIVRNVAGLSSGTYYYEGKHHQLAVLDTPHHVDPSTLISRSRLGYFHDVLPELVIVLSGAFARISLKYGAFGYRLIHFDAGVALGRLKATADALGIDAIDISFWDDDLLERSLLLRGFDEPIVGAMAFFAKRHSVPSSQTVYHPTLPPGNVIRTDRLGEPASPMSLARTIYQQSRSDVCTADTAPIFTSFPKAQGHQDEARLSPSLSDIWSSTLARHSRRQFKAEVVDLTIAEKILKYTLANSALRASDTTTEIFISLAVDSLPGSVLRLFSYSSGQDSLIERCVAPSSMPASNMFIDPSFAEAPATFWICGNVECHPRRYRQLLVEAGRRAYDLMSAAQDFGLCGVITAGIRSSSVGRVLGLNYVHDTPLIAFVAGFDSALS